MKLVNINQPKVKGREMMSKIENFIVSLGGKKVKEMKNIITPSFLFRFENDIYLNIEYDQRDQYKAVHLGKLFLMTDIFPRLIVLGNFEVFLQSANSIGLETNYSLPYHKLSYDQMVDNVACNLSIVLENYEKLFEISKTSIALEEDILKEHLIKDVSSCSATEIEREASDYIYKPKVHEIDSLKLKDLELKQKEKSDAFRQRYNLPQNIYTDFEYWKLEDKKKNLKVKFVWCFIIQAVALVIWILGLVNNHWFVGNNVVYFNFIVVVIAVTGLFVVTGVKVHRMNLYEPILAFFVPFVFLDQIIKTENNTLILWGTVIFGVLFTAWRIYEGVIVPDGKTKKATLEYSQSFEAQYGLPKSATVDYRDIWRQRLYLENGRHVCIGTLGDDWYEIVVWGSVFYKKIKTRDVIIDYMEVECTYEEAIAKALELLEKNNRLLIFKE